MANKFIYLYLRHPQQFKYPESSYVKKSDVLLVLGSFLCATIAFFIPALIHVFPTSFSFDKSFAFEISSTLYLLSLCFICFVFFKFRIMRSFDIFLRTKFDIFLRTKIDIPEQSIFKVEDVFVNSNSSDGNFVVAEDLQDETQKTILNNHIKSKNLSMIAFIMEEREAFLKERSDIDNKSFLYTLLQEQYHLLRIHRVRYEQFCQKNIQQENANFWMELLNSLIIFAIFLDLLSIPFPQITVFFDTYYYPMFENIEDYFSLITLKELIYFIFRLGLCIEIMNKIGRYLWTFYAFKSFSRYSDTLCFWQILCLNIDLYNEELFRIPEAVDLCNRRINYIKNLTLQIPKSYRYSSRENKEWTNKHFRAIHLYLSERQKWLYAPQETITLNQLRKDFDELLKIYTYRNYGEFEWDLSLSQFYENQFTIPIIAKVIILGAGVILLILGFSLSKNYFILVGISIILYMLDDLLKLNILKNVIDTVKEVKDLSK